MKGPHLKFIIWCTIGLLLSAYATFVELRAEQDANYKAMCDLSAKVSCTAVFTSAYGKGFGLLQYVFGADDKWIPPNGVLGIFFYIFLIITAFFRRHYWLSLLQLAACLVANLLSVYLAFLLYYVLDALCLVCISIYAVNYFCLLESWCSYKASCESLQRRRYSRETPIIVWNKLD